MCLLFCELVTVAFHTLRTSNSGSYHSVACNMGPHLKVATGNSLYGLPAAHQGSVPLELPERVKPPRPAVPLAEEDSFSLAAVYPPAQVGTCLTLYIQLEANAPWSPCNQSAGRESVPPTSTEYLLCTGPRCSSIVSRCVP